MDEAWNRAVAAAAGGQSDPQILTLDGAVKCPNGRLPPPALFEKFSNLDDLSIANVRLASLDGFPRLPKLRRLTLSDNRIAGGLDSLVAAGLDALSDLDLSNNRIGSIDDLAPLAKLKLESLDLYECPVTKTKDYRAKVFGMITSLKYLDKMDADGNERPESDEDDEDEDEDDDEGEEAEEGVGNGRAKANGSLGEAEGDEEDLEDEEDDDAEEEEDDEEEEEEEEEDGKQDGGDQEGEGEEEDKGAEQPADQANDGTGDNASGEVSPQHKRKADSSCLNDETDGSRPPKHR